MVEKSLRWSVAATDFPEARVSQLGSRPQALDAMVEGTPTQRARGSWRDAFLHRRKDEEKPAPRQRAVRENDFDEKAMLAQDRAMIEQLQRKPPRESAVRKKPPTPPKVSPYKFRLDTAPPSPSNDSDQVQPPTETVSETAPETGPETTPDTGAAAEPAALPAPAALEPPAPAEPLPEPPAELLEELPAEEPAEPVVEQPSVTVVPKSGELFSAADIDSIMNSITGEEPKVDPSTVKASIESRRDRRLASETEFSIPDRSKLRDQIRAIDSWLEDDVTCSEQVKEGLRLRHDDVSLQEVMAKTGKASKAEGASEAELFSKLESAKGRSKAGEKLPAAEMKDLAQRAKPMLPNMNLEKLVRALNLFSATGYEDYDLYLNILGEIPVQVRGISPELLTKCLRLLWRLRFNEETYLELFSMEAMNMIRAKKPPRRPPVRRPAEGPVEVKAAPKPALAPFSGRMLIQIGNCLTQLGAKHPSRFMDVYQEQIAIAIPSLSQEDCELVTPCLAASPLLPDALRRAFLERCAEVDAGAPLVAPEASATPEIARYQRDAEVYRRRAKHWRNIFMIEASIRKETWAFFSSLPAEVRSYLDRVHERSKELKHPKPLGFAAEVATVLDQLGVPTWSTMAGPLEVHLVQANHPGVEAEDVVYECNEAEAYCAMRQEDRTPQLTMATKLRHKLLQRLGLQLVHINYWEWSRLSEAQRINYMVKLQARQVG
eukprot:s200_g45.t1